MWLSSELSQCLVLIFLEKINPTPPSPQHNFLPSDEKLTVVVGGGRGERLDNIILTA